MKKLVHLLLLLTVSFCYGQNANDLNIQAKASEDKNDYVNAIKTLLTIFGADQSNYLVANQIACDFVKLKDYRTAIIWAQKSINLKPDFATAYINLGNAYLGQSAFDRAKYSFEISVKLDSNAVESYYGLSLVALQKGNSKEAINQLEKAYGINPYFEDLAIKISEEYEKLNDNENAYKSIKRFVRQYPESVEGNKIYSRILKAIRLRKFSFPTIVSTGKTTESFLPEGWKIKDKVEGDLNSDHLPDAAMVIEYKAFVSEVRLHYDTIEDHPRMLFVLFKNGTHYDLVLQQNTFILRANEGLDFGEDDFDTITIEKGVLNVGFQYLRSYANYKFKYQLNDLYLIGASYHGVDHNILFGWEFNFSTKKALHTWGESTDPDDKDAKNKSEWREIRIQTLKKLSDMKQPFSWEIFKDVSI